MRKRNLIIIFLLALIIGGLFLFSFFGSFDFGGEDSDRPDNPPTTGAEIEAPKQTIEELAEQISSLSPVDSEPGSSWKLKRVEFVDGDNFYVEYTDGALQRRLLLRREPPEVKRRYKVVGFFRPGENLWKLVQGENPYFGTPVEIYEKNSEGEWEKVS
jgi:hypothetical protein